MEDYKFSMAMKLVSVIIPTYARPKFLSRAIESVLSQTYKNIEIIVVDDNGEGTENQKYTEQLIHEFIDSNKVVYIKHSVNKNGAAARNTGLNNSHGEYIAFLDDDDQFLPLKIEKQVAILEVSPIKVGACYCNWAWFDEKKLIKVNRHLGTGNLFESMLLMENIICGGSSLLIRRNVCKELEGFDDSFKRHQDWEFLIRFFRKYELTLVNEVLLYVHLESRIFTSNPDIVEKVRVKFLSTFENDINQCKSANKIFMLHYYAICIAFLRGGKLKDGIKWYKKSRSFYNVGFTRFVRCLYAYGRSLLN